MADTLTLTQKENETLAANVAEAQRSGDLCYEFVLSMGGTGAEAADAYHRAYARSMWENGTPAPCHCEWCQRAVAEWDSEAEELANEIPLVIGDNWPL